MPAELEPGSSPRIKSYKVARRQLIVWDVVTARHARQPVDTFIRYTRPVPSAGFDPGPRNQRHGAACLVAAVRPAPPSGARARSPSFNTPPSRRGRRPGPRWVPRQLILRQRSSEADTVTRAVLAPRAAREYTDCGGGSDPSPRRAWQTSASVKLPPPTMLSRSATSDAANTLSLPERRARDPSDQSPPARPWHSTA